VTSPLACYEIVDLSWQIQVLDDGPPHILNGTIQEVRDQILAINPNYRFLTPAERTGNATSATTETKLRNQDRDVATIDHLICCN
jgi:hypothetical protein